MRECEREDMAGCMLKEMAEQTESQRGDLEKA